MNLFDPFMMFPAVDVLGFVLSTRLPLATVSTTLTTCAAKLPVLSRSTSVFGVLRLVPPTIESTYAFVAASVGLVVVPAKVIIFVEKLPELSRNTIVFGVFELVAVVAELATLPAVEIVANLVSIIAAAGSTSAFTISELDKLPDASL